MFAHIKPHCIKTPLYDPASFGPLLDRSWAVLGPLLTVLGPLGSSWTALGPLLGALGPISHRRGPRLQAHAAGRARFTKTELYNSSSL